jgi:hypothetical protein
LNLQEPPGSSLAADCPLRSFQQFTQFFRCGYPQMRLRSLLKREVVCLIDNKSEIFVVQILWDNLCTTGIGLY